MFGGRLRDWSKWCRASSRPIVSVDVRVRAHERRSRRSLSHLDVKGLRRRRLPSALYRYHRRMGHIIQAAITRGASGAHRPLVAEERMAVIAGFIVGSPNPAASKTPRDANGGPHCAE